MSAERPDVYVSQRDGSAFAVDGPAFIHYALDRDGAIDWDGGAAEVDYSRGVEPGDVVRLQRIEQGLRILRAENE